MGSTGYLFSFVPCFFFSAISEKRKPSVMCLVCVVNKGERGRRKEMPPPLTSDLEWIIIQYRME